MKTLHQSNYMELHYYEAHFLHIDWKGYLNVQQVKDGCEIIFKVMQEKECYHAINDNRKVKGSWTQAIRWLEQDFMPRVIDIGLQKIAFLYSPYESAKYSVNRLLEVNDQYEAQIFENFKEATQWLIGDKINEQPDNNSILIKTLDRHTKIYLNDIYYLSRHNGKTLIQTQVQQYSTRKSLADLLALLPSSTFYRIHKSHIVNISKIKSLKYYEGGY